MEISCADHVRYEEVLQRVREYRNILHTITRRKAKWIGQLFALFPKHDTGRRIQARREVNGRRKRSSKQLLDVLKKKTDTGN